MVRGIRLRKGYRNKANFFILDSLNSSGDGYYESRIYYLYRVYTGNSKSNIRPAVNKLIRNGDIAIKDYRIKKSHKSNRNVIDRLLVITEKGKERLRRIRKQLEEAKQKGWNLSPYR